jgi:hypothetical protein
MEEHSNTIAVSSKALEDERMREGLERARCVCVWNRHQYHTNIKNRKKRRYPSSSSDLTKKPDTDVNATSTHHELTSRIDAAHDQVLACTRA